MDDINASLFFIGILALLIITGIILLRWLMEMEGTSGSVRGRGSLDTSTAMEYNENRLESRKERGTPHIPEATRTISPERYQDMGEGLMALADLYGLEKISIASLDGLLVASSGVDAEEDAAVYSQLFVKGEKISDPAVRLIPLQHGPVSLLCILKGEEDLVEVGLKDITDNISKILKQWL
ncbi:MAG: hypothetical protein QHG99_05950 [Methanomicrobiales archaeon]|nr:hypothetical protein [Methanomicrobiales archaeon]